MISQLSIPQYLVESSFCLVIFYVFYHFVLRRETYFQLNRAYLIISAQLSLAIPILNIDLSTAQAITGSDAILPLMKEITSMQTGIQQTISKPSQVLQISIADAITWIYISGLFVMTLKLMSGLFKLFNIISRSPKMKDRGHTLLISDDVPAASFFSYIFWKNKADKNDPTQQAILEHEMVHVRQWHSIDIIVMEIMVIIKWFNPLIYLFRNSLRKTHEYIADRYVTERLDANTYANILLRNVSNVSVPATTSPFYGHIKDRIHMLSQKKSTAIAIARYLFAVPIMIILIGLFSFDMTDNLPQPIKASLQQMESTVRSSTDYNILSLTLNEDTEAQKIRLLWTEAVHLIIDQHYETQEMIMNYSRSDLSEILSQKPKMQQGGKEMKVHVDTLEIIHNNRRYAVELSDLADDEMRRRLIDSLSKQDQLIVGLRAYSATDSLKLKLYLGIDHGANDKWHFISDRIRHTLRWGHQTIDFANIEYSDGTFLNLDHVVTASDIEELLTSPIYLSVDGGKEALMSDRYAITFNLKRSTNSNLASIDLSKKRPYGTSNSNKNNQATYLSSQYHGRVYDVVETKYHASLSDFYNQTSDFREWLNTASNGDNIEVELRVPDSHEPGYKFQMRYKDAEEAINVPFPVTLQYANDHPSRYQLVMKDEGKSLIRLDASNPANADLVSMYSQSESFEIVDIKDFQSNSRFHTNNLPDGVLNLLDINDRSLSELDVLRLNEYSYEADQLIRLDWGKMISMPNIGNYSMKEFRRSSKVNPQLFVGTKPLTLARYDLLIIPKNGKIKRYRTDKMNTTEMREVLAQVPENTSIYFDNIIIDHDGKLLSYPVDFVFTVE